jgi:hypothetical protein
MKSIRFCKYEMSVDAQRPGEGGKQYEGDIVPIPNILRREYLLQLIDVLL